MGKEWQWAKFSGESGDNVLCEACVAEVTESDGGYATGELSESDLANQVRFYGAVRCELCGQS